ncbi:putative membrane protein [Prauserella isguenensis]|uniref:Putative membrane protein n=1 Tax=Prauserella isguenensis TaxID=1470180 RepID=A0A839S0X8_9PSEU|nr:putative membrane protein [Prauserella isguenensis]
MDGPRQQAKHPVSAALAGPYGHPFHPILVTVPIGAWVASLVFDVASWLVVDPGFLAQGSVWLIGLGVLGAVAAALVGVLDLFAIPTGTPAFRLGLLHMALNLTVTAAYAVNFVWRQADYGRPGPVPAAMLTLSVAGVIVLAVAGYLGGKLAYRYGVRVADEKTQATGYTTRDDPSGR